MKLKKQNLEGKFFLCRQIGSTLKKNKVKIKKEKKNCYLVTVKFTFGKRKYHTNRAQIAARIQNGEFIER